eukprot:NODE_2607_length_462_cov_85.050147_g2589_i0.p1 GENE.NODE_2607_length_462_cov_85.050147_g2589_i0~~NODE_2607_length_462_cov_85.050147_g2589_i0.p1  ORF type:complete len:100 (+),score=3.33 NODE_2607_length_462_cov_85.050147_g2589_i0:107-406(+)
MVTPSSSSASACYTCGQQGHRSASCPQKVSYCRRCGGEHETGTCRGQQKGACFQCGLDGHMIADCPENMAKTATACYKCGNEGHIAKHCPGKQQQLLAL